MSETQTAIPVDFGDQAIQDAAVLLGVHPSALTVFAPRSAQVMARQLQGSYGFALVIVPVILFGSHYTWGVEAHGDLIWSRGGMTGANAIAEARRFVEHQFKSTHIRDFGQELAVCGIMIGGIPKPKFKPEDTLSVTTTIYEIVVITSGTERYIGGERERWHVSPQEAAAAFVSNFCNHYHKIAKASPEWTLYWRDPPTMEYRRDVETARSGWIMMARCAMAPPT